MESYTGREKRKKCCKDPKIDREERTEGKTSLIVEGTEIKHFAL